MANGLTRATAATAASRAKASTADLKIDPAAGKRKREALGEVTGLVTNNRTRGPAAAAKTLKGKDKEVIKDTTDDIALKPKTTTATIRQPLRTVVGPTTRRTTRSTFAVARQQDLDKQKEEPDEPVVDENAMVIDDPAVPTHVRRVSKRKSGASVHNTATAEIIPHHPENNQRVSIHTVRQPEDEAESSRVFKKRRTSSDAPNEVEGEQPVDESEIAAARIAAELESCIDLEPEADPDGDQWEDLDADDNDDPLMVSEYVVDIFKYLKEIEVKIHFLFGETMFRFLPCSKQQCQTLTTWRVKRSSLGRCAGSLPTGSSKSTSASASSQKRSFFASILLTASFPHVWFRSPNFNLLGSRVCSLLLKSRRSSLHPSSTFCVVPIRHTPKRRFYKRSGMY